MSKTVKTIAKIALPIALGFALGPAGFGLMSAGWAGATGGAIAGAVNGGGLKGAALGAATGYMTAGLGDKIVGTAAHTLPAGVSGPVTSGSGIMGAVTGGGTQALANTVTQGAGAAVAGSATKDSVGQQLLAMGNQAVTLGSVGAIEDATKEQIAGIEAGKANLAPYTELGQNALKEMNTINADPTSYIKNNTLYNTLADDAERRLLANQAAKGKVASGGTQNELQTQLLGLGNGLVNDRLNQLGSQVSTGYGAATNTAGLNTTAGAAQSAGTIGADNALTGGYQNQINTLLAMQNLNKNKVPTYSPTAINI